jgi:hypothetical protein
MVNFFALFHDYWVERQTSCNGGSLAHAFIWRRNRVMATIAMATEEEIDRERRDQVKLCPQGTPLAEVEWLPWKQAIGEADVVLVGAFDELHAKQTFEACQGLLVGKVLVDCTQSEFPARCIGSETAHSRATLRYVRKVTDKAKQGLFTPSDTFAYMLFSPHHWITDQMRRMAKALHPPK